MSPIATINYAIPPSRLGHDSAIYMQPENLWPQESFEVPLVDLRSELSEAGSVSTQLEAQGFAVLNHHSTAIGPLSESEVWNDTYLEECVKVIKEELGADEVFVWNSVVRSADPAVNAPYGTNHLQKKAIAGLQFGSVVRPTAAGAHVDQDAPNSIRMCKLAAGDDLVYNAC